jgi:hypothetical protein
LEAGEEEELVGRVLRWLPLAAGDASAAAAAVAPACAYGGEYLAKIVELLEKGKESATADASRTEELSRQVDALRRLEAAMAARQREDPTLCGSRGRGGPEDGRGVGFDAGVDDDEVLLRLMREVDTDGSGTVSMAELLAAPLLRRPENAEMARVLRRAAGCDLRAVEVALEAVEEADLAQCAQRAARTPAAAGGEDPGSGEGAGRVWSRGTAVGAIFNAILPPLEAAVQHEAGQPEAAGNVRMAARADLARFRSAEEVRVPGSAVAKALDKLLQELPADGQELDFLAVKAAARKVPRVAAQRLEWVRSRGIDAALARHLPPGTLDDG